MIEAFGSSIIPQNDEQRLEALKRYQISNTRPEESFNNIARLMAEFFSVPIALVSIVGKDKVYFKGNVGMPGVSHTARNVSLCSFAILSPEPTVFEKPLEEPCLLSNPLVHGEFGLRFYAGAPLVTSDGFNIGSVCLVDRKERTFTDTQQEMLQRFSTLVMHEIELRLAFIKQEETAQELKATKERFDLVSKATHDVIWDWDLNTNFLWWNEGFKELFGYSEKEVEPNIDSWYNRVHEDDKKWVVESIHEIIDKGGSNWSAEYRFRKADNSYAIVLDRGYALHDKEGKPYRMLGSMQDITERKSAEAALQQSEASTRLAVDAANLGTFQINVAEQTMIHSPRAAEIIGLDGSRQWPYQTFIDALHPDDHLIREKAHEEAKKTGKLFYEARIVHPDRSIHWLRLNGSLLQQNHTTLVIGTMMDTTEERKAAEVLEQKIEERTKELQQVNTQLKEFTYAASHDLQEPLRKISFFVERLLTSVGPDISDDSKRVAERIQHTTKRMRNLIDDLLNYSNTTLGVTSFGEVELNNVVKEVLDDMEATVIEKGATIDIHPLPYVKGDQRQLRQLFQNLLSNAIKYHKKDTLPLVQIVSKVVSGDEIKADLPQRFRKGDFHQIQVRDNGIGFDPDDAERIFRIFQRLHGKSEYEGTGVGLAIVQKVVENHQGYIWAESTPGEGATFKILLPVG